MQGVKLTPSEIERILVLHLKHPHWSLRQISNHTRRHGKHLGVSHQTVKRILDTHPDVFGLKPTDCVEIKHDIPNAIFPLAQGETVRIIDFTHTTILVSAAHYPRRAIDIPPTAIRKK